MEFLDSSDGFVRINREKLAGFIGSTASQRVFAALEGAGFIESNHSWQVGKKSLGWRLTGWAAALPRGFQLTTQPFWGRYFEEEETKLTEALSVHPAHVIIWESLHQLSLHPFHKGEKPLFEGDEGAFRRKSLHWERAIRRIADDEWRFSWDWKTGRVFNNITSLPRALRRYVCLCGEPCVEIDVACSQPFLLASLYPADSAEKSRYLEVVRSGTFYEVVGAAAGVDWQLTGKGRDWLKEQIYAQILFGPVCRGYPLWRGFCGLFPELGTIIVEKKKGNLSELALAMQKVEASAMVRGVVPELESTFPLLPVLTVHDSLLVPEEYVTIAQEVMRRHFKAAIGCDPTLRLTPTAIPLLD